MMCQPAPQFISLLLFLHPQGVATTLSAGVATRTSELAGLSSFFRAVVGLIRDGYPAVSPLLRRRPVSNVATPFHEHTEAHESA
jgi:hypothetical protein